MTEPARLYGPLFQQDPAGVYAEIRRRHGPVAPVLLAGEVPAWFVCGYRELDLVATDPQLFARDTRRWNGWERVPDDWPLLPFLVYNPSVLFTEGPEHRSRAGAISDALSGVDHFELAAQCEKIADQLIDGFAGRGEAELISQYAERVPLRAVAVMYGMSDADATGLLEDIAASLEETRRDSMAAYDRIEEAMLRLLDHKADFPGTDLPTRLLQDPANLYRDEIALDLRAALSFAHQYTANWIGNTLRLLLTDERFARGLAGGRTNVGAALNEVLRLDTPTQNYLGRIATRDTRLGEQHIHAGDLIVLGLAAANADPEVSGGDGAAAGNRAQLSFGHGEHGCPYPAQELAEMIATTSIEVILDRLPDLALAVPPHELRWRASAWTRGLLNLPVTFTPTYVG